MKAVIIGALLALLGVAACTVVVGLDAYRSCQAGECGCEGGACGDATGGGDVEASVPNDRCRTLSDCQAIDPTYSMCTAAGRCARVKSIARGAADHECVLLDDGAVVCWGTNTNGQLGTGDTAMERKQPKVVPGIAPMVSVSVGFGFTCALDALGQVYCWGTATAGGGSLAPTQVIFPAGRKAKSIASGQDDTCALLDDASIYCWGDNLWGEGGCMGDAGLCSTQDGGTATPKLAFASNPRRIADGSEGFGSIAVGVYQTCAMINSTGLVHCWGDQGHLGVDLSAWYVCCAQSDLGPPSGGPAQGLFATEFYACRKDTDGNIDCWGQNISCAFADGVCDQAVTPTIAQIRPVNAKGQFDRGAKLATGWRHMCWVSFVDPGAVYCRGSAEYGALGDGTRGGNYVAPIPGNDPPKVVGLTAPVADIAASRFFTCALQTNGELRCWGGYGTWLLGLDGKVTMPPPADGQGEVVVAATPVNWGNP